MSEQAAQHSREIESWEHTRALSLIILRIEKASLTQIKHVQWQVTQGMAEK